jgi:predicted GH43/DUF377 family glycosyl hydrolase
MRKVTKEVVRRHPENPILTADQFPWRVSSVYNSGCTKYKGRYILACRVNRLDMHTEIWLADSDDGVRFTPRPDPLPMPETEDFRQFATHVVYDPRITYLAEEKRYLMTLAVHGDLGCRPALFETKDWKTVRFLDWLSEVDNRNMVIFPEKIGGMYCRLDRPNVPGGHGKGNIWISWSPDLHFWGQSAIVLKAGQCGLFCHSGIGPCTVPHRTKEGWLVLFHGIMHSAGGCWYTLAATLLDPKDPSRVIAKTEYPILEPRAHYERHGLVPNVIFCCGAIYEDDGQVKIYYGAGDDTQCLATSTVDELIYACKHQ